MKKLLLVIDMQNDFITGALGNEDCKQVVSHVIKRMESAKTEGMKILCTKDIHGEDYLQTGEGRRLPVPHCIRGSLGSELVPEILEMEERWKNDDIFLDINPIEKSAFGSTELSRTLGNYGFDEIEIIGVCTDICVISNAMILRSDYPEVNIRVNRSCCSGVSPESHNRALRAMETCQIEIVG